MKEIKKTNVEFSQVDNDDKTVINAFDVSLEKETLSDEVKIQLNEIAGDINTVEATDADNQEIIKDEVIKDKLEEVAAATAPSKKHKNRIVSIVMLAVNLLLVYFLASNLFKSAEDASLSNLVSEQGSRLGYLSWCLLLFFIVVLADSLFIALILKVTTKKWRFGLAYKTSSIGKYYEAITPLSAGGQPAQIVYLSKRNVSPGIATSVPIIRVTLINFATILVAVFLFVGHIPDISGGNGLADILIGLLEILTYIGIIINSLYFIAIFIIANSNVVGRSLARTIVKVGYKFKIVKDYRSAYKKIINQVAEYQNSINYLKRHVFVLLISIVLVLIEILALASIPFVVAVGLSNIEFLTVGEVFEFWAECLIKYYICYFASSYIPLPGGTGMMEISFVILFASLISPDFLVWGFLIWRFASYYATIIQGFIISIFDFFVGIFKRKSST